MLTDNAGFLAWSRYQIITAVAIQLVFTLSSSEQQIQRFKRYFLTYHKEVELIEEPVCNITVVPLGHAIESHVNITCPGTDFVRCYLSKCRVDVKEMQRHNYEDISCRYDELTFKNGRSYVNSPIIVYGRDGVFKLTSGDQVRISCTLTDKYKKIHTWTGYGWGLGGIHSVDSESSEDPVNGINVLMIGFASLSHNVFIRKMPQSYEYLKNTLGATFLNGYNVVDNSTIGELYPLLTGKSEAQMAKDDDEQAFLFHKVKKIGYRTAVYENMPREHTRHRFYRKFKVHPADHSALPMNQLARTDELNKFCIGNTPIYKLFLNATAQFFKGDDSGRFLFTFIADFRNGNIDKIGNADETLTALLHGLRKDGRLRDTLLVVFGERGPRYPVTLYENELEERLPLMAIRLPEALKRKRPEAQIALESNIDALTTPYDIHATILDVLDLRGLSNTYKVPNVAYFRGLTLLAPTPLDRRCKEADVNPNLCNCLNWDPVGISDIHYKRVPEVLVDALNGLTEFQRSHCALRHLKSIDWIIKQTLNQKIVQKHIKNGQDNLLNESFFNFESFKVQLIVSPGHAVFKSIVFYDLFSREYSVDFNHIHRINQSKDEIHCLDETYPYLNNFCYCRYNYVNI